MLRVTAPMRRDVPTCALTDRIGDVRQRTRELGWDICVVVNEERVILGLLHSKAWDAAPETLVEEVMSNGPPTTRPSTFLDDMVDRLQKRNVPGILISDASGVLMGYLWRTDA
ncbi:MAG TPA: CBS domain-containing protein, partial [Thermomicrobiales bacterium]|nr:CBS domain-containing protein [Thermomicrobiales bacterium]